MKQAPLTLRRWKRVEYERLVDLGVFQGDPVELLGGHLVVAEPQGSYHATAVGTVDDALRVLLPPGWIVRAQMPVALDDESAPEPDLVVVSGPRADYRESHPARPALAVEVADSSLDFDRQQKGSHRSPAVARAPLRQLTLYTPTSRASGRQASDRACNRSSAASITSTRSVTSVTPVNRPTGSAIARALLM